MKFKTRLVRVTNNYKAKLMKVKSRKMNKINLFNRLDKNQVIFRFI